MMNLADPELELIDPTPNVYSMFLHFDKTFFWAKLSSRCVVRWSKRMYSCAGICSYEGRGGLCDIALSEPLLKLRPRKDLVETLLHEMIHAYLFVTKRDQDRDGHGPNFQAHMHRINRAAGLNISIYHDFHDEVKLYQTHWWRCSGPCQLQKPYFGIVRRTCNRAPGPSDYWWNSHKRNCGGTYIKIKEPNKPEKKSKKTKVVNPNADISKYISVNNNNNVDNKNIIKKDKPKPVLKDSSNVLVNPKVGTKMNNTSTLVVTKKNVLFSPQVPKSKPVVFNGTGNTISTEKPNNSERKRSSSASVLETVRNVWSNKQIGTNDSKQQLKPNNPIIKSNENNQKLNDYTKSPPAKIKKIDDYFKTTATSMLKNLYGQDFNLTQLNGDQKLKAVPRKDNLVDCPVCSSKIDSSEINTHLDECLNKGILEKISKESIPVIKIDSVINTTNVNNNANDRIHLKDKDVESDKEYKKATILKQKDHTKPSCDTRKKFTNNDIIDLTNIGVTDVNRKRSRTSFDHVDLKNSEQLISEVGKKNSKIRKSDSFNSVRSINTVQTAPVLSSKTIKVEPGSSKCDTTLDTACPCCGDKLNKSVDEHLDECLSFFENNTSIPEEGASTSYGTIVIEDDADDEFDESQTFNATGTKFPCPCCFKMIEEIDMNSHLDKCLC